MKRKAQLVITDLLFVVIILIILFTVSIAMWNTSMIRVSQRDEVKNLESTAIALSDLLVKTKGVPGNWEERNITIEYTADSYTTGLWHMNEGTGDIVGDSSSYANAGTRHGASWKSATDCMFNPCLQFDGDDYVNIPHSSQYDSQTFSVELWVYPELITDGSERVILHKNNQWRVKLLSNMRIDFYVVGVGNWQTTVAVSSTKWTNLAFTVEKAATVTVSIYFDGERVFYQTGIAGTPQFSTNPIEVGKPPTGVSWYKGKIDDIRISNVARTVLKTFDVSSFGLANSGNILDSKKVSTFVDVDYSYVKKLFGGYDFYFQLDNTNNQIVTIDGKEMTFGLQPVNARNVVNARRIALLNNQPVFLNLMVWK